MQQSMLHYRDYPYSTKKFIKRTLKKYPWRVRTRISVEDIHDRIIFLDRFYFENQLPNGKTILDMARIAGAAKTCDEAKLLILDGDELEDLKQKLTFRKNGKSSSKSSNHPLFATSYISASLSNDSRIATTSGRCCMHAQH